MLSVIVFIIILGVLIFVHELGHFVTAKRNGIKADEFGFGFPPRILGIQFLSGKKIKKEIEIEETEVKELATLDEDKKTKKSILIKKIIELFRVTKIKRWRLIWGSKDGDEKNEKEDLKKIEGGNFEKGTIYSINWIPLGGFVKIKGEDGNGKKDPDSFSSKSAWIRIKVLGAGVFMNFVLAWVLISIVFMIGAPQTLVSEDETDKNSKIQISNISPSSPAEIAGLKIGDEILKTQRNNNEDINLKNIESAQEYIKNNQGKELLLKIKRGDNLLEIKATPRLDVPEGEGPLGISLAETAIYKYPWYESLWIGFKTTIEIILMILFALGEIIKNLFLGKSIGAEIAGPIGIAVLTKEVTTLGIVYILQFAAFLSINLGIINILPIPALDGGRIVFIIIEKIKGSPVSQKIEQTFHSVGFMLLIALLVLVTFKDVLKYIK